MAWRGGGCWRLAAALPLTVRAGELHVLFSAAIMCTSAWLMMLRVARDREGERERKRPIDRERCGELRDTDTEREKERVSFGAHVCILSRKRFSFL